MWEVKKWRKYGKTQWEEWMELVLGENESNIFSKRIKGWYSIMGAGCLWWCLRGWWRLAGCRAEGLACLCLPLGDLNRQPCVAYWQANIGGGGVNNTFSSSRLCATVFLFCLFCTNCWIKTHISDLKGPSGQEKTVQLNMKQLLL